MEKEHLSSGANMLKNSLKILDTTKRNIFWAELLSESRKNPVKLLLCRFQQYLRRFNMLTVQGCTELWLFRHLHNHDFHRL